MITVYQYLHPFHVGDCSSLSCWRCMPLSCGLLWAMKCKKKWCMSLPVALPYFFFCLTRDYYWYSKKWFLFLKVPAQRWWQHEGESLLSQSVMSSSTGEKQTFAFLCHWKLGVACYHSAWKGVCVCECVCVCVCCPFSHGDCCNPMDCSPPGSSVHGILQARVLGWVAMPSSFLSHPGIEPVSPAAPALQANFLALSNQGNPSRVLL